MNRKPKPPRLDTPTLAALCISWLLEDELVLPGSLRTKLTVPGPTLLRVLALLTNKEREILQRVITKRGTTGALPGPLRPPELCAVLDSLGAAPRASDRQDV